MFTRFLNTGIILLLTATYALAVQIEGLWEVQGSNDMVEIRSFGDGIEAKFTHQSNWVSYEFLRKNIYEDRRGNRYYVKSNNRIRWESRDGRRTFNLNRARNDYDYYGRDEYRADRNEYDYYDNNRRSGRSDRVVVEVHPRPRIGADPLSGTWVNRWRNRYAYVDFNGITLRIKTDRSQRWTKYYRTNRRRMIFEDRFGNRIRFKRNGEMEWRRADRRREIEFRKVL